MNISFDPIFKIMRTVTLLFVLCLSLTAKAQSSKKLVEIANPRFDEYFFHHSPPSIYGKIIHATNQELNEIDVSYVLVTPTSDFQQPSKSLKINKDGTFILKLDYALPYQQIWLSVGDYFYAGLYANKDLTLELDLAKLKKKNVSFLGDGVKYAGTDGPLNEFMNSAIVYDRQQQLNISDKLNLLQANNGNYIKCLDSLFAEQKKINDGFIRLHPSVYSWILNNELTSDYYIKILHYAITTGIESPQWEQIRAHKIYLISNTSIIFINNLYTYCAFFKLQKDFTAKNHSKQAHGLDSLLGSAHADLLKMQMHSQDVQENEAILHYLMSSVKSRWCKFILSKKHQESIERVRNVNNILKQTAALNPDSTIGKPIGSLAFGAKLSSVSDMEPEEFIRSLKTLFKGNVLMIDFWATWCSPCLGAMPYSLKLSNQAANMPVKFIYLCTAQGSNIDLWKNTIADLRQTGTYIFVNQKLMQKLMVLFGKSGFPSYLLINSSGQLAKEDIKSISTVTIDDLRKWTNEK
ncbi:MAG TPA: TlpA family protein disulfide reductase [Mucilaginibacter sp.]